MNEIGLGKNILRLRRAKGITQDELAAYLGVSKSSVSKWENSGSYPDIVLLPQLASLFNVSMDELMGYEPQLGKKQICEKYEELSERMAEENPENVLQTCEEWIRKYNSCFPFLLQMAIFFLNHAEFFQDSAKVYERGEELCRRIIQESGSPSIIKEAVTVEALILVMEKKPEQVLDLLGEDIPALSQDTELVANAYQMLGNQEKAKELLQICGYQHLLFFIQDLGSYAMLYPNESCIVDETMDRLFRVAEIFHLDKLHQNTALNLYLMASMVHAGRKEKEKCLQLLEQYVRVAQDENLYYLHGDEFFYYVEDWLKNLALGNRPPRDPKLIRKSILGALEQNPAFDFIKEELRYKRCVEQLKQQVIGKQ